MRFCSVALYGRNYGDKPLHYHPNCQIFMRQCTRAIGDYRFIYEVLYDEEVIIVHEIGHRKEIYRGK
ncbi:MAG: type II toxin-antitoxin system RelE/ParE family toxin [Candidatus Edwardsbacteria bacterium]